jgi:hypothetical protein
MVAFFWGMSLLDVSFSQSISYGDQPFGAGDSKGALAPNHKKW